MKGLQSPTQQALMDHAIDITRPRVGVELQVDNRRTQTVLHVNVDGVCVLRICGITPGALELLVPVQQTRTQDGEISHGCKKPPQGWECSREAGHDGPCAAYPTETRTPGFTPKREPGW